MKKVGSRWPLLLAAAALLILAAVERAETRVNDPGAWAMMAAGLVTLGAWVALEARGPRGGEDDDE